MKGLDGKDGIDGKNGVDGIDGKNGDTPFIGENGNWWLGVTDIGVKAAGVDGEKATREIKEMPERTVKTEQTEKHLSSV